jgi:hypothetical protein
MHATPDQVTLSVEDTHAAPDDGKLTLKVEPGSTAATDFPGTPPKRRGYRGDAAQRKPAKARSKASRRRNRR